MELIRAYLTMTKLDGVTSLRTKYVMLVSCRARVSNHVRVCACGMVCPWRAASLCSECAQGAWAVTKIVMNSWIATSEILVFLYDVENRIYLI